MAESIHSSDGHWALRIRRTYNELLNGNYGKCKEIVSKVT